MRIESGKRETGNGKRPLKSPSLPLCQRGNTRGISIFRFLVLFLSLSLFTFHLSRPLQAAEIQSTNNGLWQNTTTWLGGVVPGSADHAFITTHTVTLNVDVLVASITIAGGGRITTSTNTITLTENFASSGTFTPGTSTVTFLGPLPSVIRSTLPALGFNQLYSSKDANVALTVSVPLDINDDFYIFNGTFSAGSFEHRVAGDWTEKGGKAIFGAGSILTFDGGAPQALNIASSVGDFTTVIDSGVGTRNLTFLGPMDIKGDLKLLSSFASITVGASGDITLLGNFDKPLGTFSMTLPSTITFEGGTPQTITGAAPLPTFGNFISSSALLQILSDIDINGDFEMDTFQTVFASRAITLAGNLRVPPGGASYTSSAGVVHSTITLDGTGTQNISLNGNTPLFSLTVNKSAGSASLAAFLVSDGNLTLTAGTFAGGTQTMDVRGDVNTTPSAVTYSTGAGHSLRLSDSLGLGVHDISPGTSFGGNLDIIGGTAAIAGVSSITVNGFFTVQPGKAFDGSDDTIAVAGNVSLLGTYTNNTGSWIELVGSSPTQSLNGASPQNLRINKASGDFLILPGTLTVLGDFIFQLGTFNTNGGQNLEVQGNFRQTGGTFAPTNGALELSGPASTEIQRFSGNLFNLVINKPATGFNVTAKSALTINGSLNLPPSGSPTSSFNASTFTHTLLGDFLQTGNTFTHGGSTWTFFSGVVNQNVQGGLAWNGFTVNNGAIVRLLPGFTTVGNGGGTLMVRGNSTFDIGGATLQVQSAGKAQLGIGGVENGTFDVNTGTAIFLSGLTITGSASSVGGRLFLPSVSPLPVVKIGAGKKLIVQGKFESQASPLILLTSDNVGISSFTFDVQGGTFDVSGLTIQSSDGLIISSNTTILNANNVSFRSQMGGKPALTISRAVGAPTMTFSSWDFDSSVSTNVSAAGVPAASTITMTGAVGAKAGASFENDPNNAIEWGSAAAANLVVIAPGESFVASPPGKSGAPFSQVPGTAFQLTVRAVDAGWNLVASATHTVSMLASPAGPTFTANTPLVSGSTFFLINNTSAGTFSFSANTIGSPTLSQSVSTVTITSADTTQPSPISNLTALTGTSSGEIRLQWTTPGDDGMAGTASSYIVKYTTDAGNINNDAAFSTATPYSQGWVPIAGGGSEFRSIFLTAGVTYYIAIKAQDETGNLGVWGRSGVNVNNFAMASSSSGSDSTAPGTITTLLAVTGAGSGEVNLTWIAPGDDGTVGTVDRYEIRRTTVGFINTDADFTNATPIGGVPPLSPGSLQSRIVTGLIPNASYYFSVKAFDEVNNISLLSIPAAAVASGSSDVTLPGVIGGFTAISSGDNGARLNWTDTGDDGASGTATSLEIRWKSSSIIAEADWTTANVATGTPAPLASGTTRSFTVGGLPSATSIYFNIRAKDDAGNISPLSGSPSAFIGTSGSDTVKPNDIVNLTALVGATNGEVKLKWTAVGDDGNIGSASGYEVRYSTVANIEDNVAFGTATWFDATGWTPLAPGSEEFRVIGGLQAGTTYYWAVKAKDENINLGSWSRAGGNNVNNWVRTTGGTGGDTNAPSQITTLSAVPGGQSGAVNLTWLAVGDDGTVGIANNYDGQSSQNSNFSPFSPIGGMVAPVSPGLSPASPHIVTGLVSGVTYYFRLRALDEAGNAGPFSNVANAVSAGAGDNTPPAIITTLTAGTGAGSDQAILMWRTVGDDNMTGTPQSYSIRRTEVGPITSDANFISALEIADIPSPPAAPGDLLQFTVFGLPANTIQFFAVKAKDEVGNVSTAPSNSPSFSVGGSSDGVAPSAVNDLLAFSGATLGDVNLNWTTRGDDGIAGALTGRYRIQYATASSGQPNNLSVGWSTISAQVDVLVSAEAPSIPKNKTIGGIQHPSLLAPGASWYYFRMWAADEVPNWSALSNATTANPPVPGAGGDSVAPSAIITLAASAGANSGEVNLSWNAPGDDGGTGTAAEYDIRYSFVGAILDTFTFYGANSFAIFGEPAPVPAGPVQSMTVVLPPGNTAWFAILTRDEALNWSGISNSPSGVVVQASSDTKAPGTIADLTAVPGFVAGDIILSWTTPGDDGTFGNFNSGTQRIKYSTNLNALTTTVTDYTKVKFLGFQPGNFYESFPITGLSAGTYYFAIWTGDEVPNWSAISNIASAVAPTSGGAGGSDTSIPPASVADLSAQPGNLTGDMILKWSGVGFDGNSGALTGEYRIQYSTYILSWSTATQTNFIQFPVFAVPALSAMQKTLGGLTAGVTHYFRIWAKDSLGNWSGLSNSANSLPKSSGFAQTATGEGTASLLPATVAAGQQNVSATITFTVGGSGISPNGRIAIRVPDGWSWPQTSGNSGRITARSVSNPGVNVSSITTNNQQAIITIQGINSLGSGDVVEIVYNNGFAQFNTQTGVIWRVYSQKDGNGTLDEIAASPTMNVTAGGASFVTFTNWDMIAVKNNTASPAMQFMGVDNTFINEATVAGALTITLQGAFYSTATFSYAVDAGAQFSLTPDFAAPVASVVIPINESRSPLFYYRSTTSGFNTIRANFTLGTPKELYRGAQVLSASASSFTALSVDSGSPVPGQTSTTISPDGDGSADFAVITFKPPDLQSSWVVSISSSLDFTNPVWRWYGFGDPFRSVNWSGDSNVSWPPANVSTGSYRVKVALFGDVIQDSTTLSITLTGNVLSGSVQDETFSGVSGVRVDAYGPNYVTAMTDVNGNYSLIGVRSGTYSLYFNKFGYASTSLFGVTAPGAASVVTLKKPSLLRVHAVRSTGTAGTNPEVWGGVSARTANFSQNAFGSLHFQNNISTSDGGIIWDGSQWLSSSWTILNVSPDTFTVEANVFGYAVVSTTVYVSGTRDIILNVTKAADVFGWVILSSTDTNSSFGNWVSVDGTKSGDNSPTVWGGAFLKTGISSGVYNLRGLANSTYTLRAFASGFQPSTASVSISGGLNVGVPQFDPNNPFSPPINVTGGVDFAAFSKGGSLTGLLTINGNTTGQSVGGDGKFGLWLSAWNPTTYAGGFTEVRLTPNAAATSASYEISGLADGAYNLFTHLQGFEIDPPGVSSFTITSSSGTKNLTLLAFTGACTGLISLGGPVDFGNVTLAMSGPGVSTVTTPNGSGAFTFSNLGSGYYQFTARYATNGFTQQISLPLVNGKTVIWNPDLSGTPLTISGVVKTEASNPKWNPISNVLANASINDFRLGFATTTARIEAIPREPFNINDEIKFSGNDFGVVNPNLVRIGVMDSTGNYTIGGLSPGLYVVRNVADLDLYYDSSTPKSAFKQDVAEVRKVVFVSTNMTGVDFTLTDGFDISGTLLLPEGVADARLFTLNLKTPSGQTVKALEVSLGDPFGNIPSTAAVFTFDRVPDGDYIIQLRDNGYFYAGEFQEPKYVAKPLPLTVSGADLSEQNMELAQGGRIIGKLRDIGPTASADDDTLINSNNATRLPDGFEIQAQPNPWNGIGGNRANETSSGGGASAGRDVIDFDSDGNFTIPALPAGSYDVEFFTRNREASSLGSGSINYANLIKSGIVVEEGLTTDMGTVDLSQGLQIVGTITDVDTSTPLPNIRVQAKPSSAGSSVDDRISLIALTDTQGRYTLTGADAGEKFYDITAAVRFNPFDSRDAAGIELGQGYGELTRESVDVTQGSAVNFSIKKAPGVVEGKAVTEDGGALKNPFDESGSPTASIIMHRRGTVPRKTPVGDIEALTKPDGTFKLNDLVPGRYDLRVFSAGYSVNLQENFEVSGSTTTNLGSLTLKRGAILKGTIVKPDGSNPTKQDAQVILAGSPDFKNIVVGSLISDDITKVVTKYEIAGLQPGVEYAILVFTEDQDAILLAQGVSVSSTTETKVLNLIYKPSKPLLLPQARKTGGKIKVRIASTQSLRKRIPADDDLVGGDADGGIIWLTAGNGTISSHTLSSNRKNIIFEYTPSAGDASFKVKISSAYGSFQDSDRLASGVSPDLAQFVIDQEFEFFIGVANSKKEKVTNMQGGKVKPEGEVSGGEFPAGTFQVPSSSSVEVEFSELDGTPLGAQAPKFGAPAFSPSAYPAGIYQRLSSAMKVLSQAPKVNPFSSFFELLLPKAVSSSFGKEATLTIKYDASVADPNKLNIYWFNEGAKVYLKQDAEKTIDLVNRTISVKINHASLFVVINSNAPIISGDAYTGELAVFNFPNPFDFTTKTITLSKPDPAGSATQSIRGTMIRIAIPAALDPATASIKIYNVAGERVRTLSYTSELAGLKAGKYNYVEWDGRNDDAQDVASGVYVGELILGGQKKFFKMAVIK